MIIVWQNTNMLLQSLSVTNYMTKTYIGLIMLILLNLMMLWFLFSLSSQLNDVEAKIINNIYSVKACKYPTAFKNVN